MLKKIILALILMCTSIDAISQSDTLRVGYRIEPPFVKKSANNSIFGPSVWLWENIAHDNNLKYKYIPLEFEELLQGLEDNKIDVSLSPFTITSERIKSMSFSSPYYITHSGLLQREVSPVQKSLQFVKSFFSVNFLKALGGLVFVILVFGILIWLFERHTNNEEFDKSPKGIWEGFWWSAVTMTTVGYGDKSPRSTGGRIVSLIWMFTAIIIISGFTAGIASSLTLNNISDSNSQMRDFKEKKLGTLENSATSEWLKNNFYNNKEEYKSIKELLTALDQKKIDAIAYDRPTLQNIYKNDTLSRYSLVDLKYNPQFYAFGIRKKIPDSIKEVINYSMLYNIEKMDWKVLLSESGLD
jgi:ABC-type amino acid transport substrate-binding protein